jgi:hypothetical protein
MSRIPEPSLAGFERRLLDALTEVDAQRPAAPPAVGAATTVAGATRPRWTRPVLVAASVAALVAGGTVLGALMAPPGPGRDGAGPGTDSAPAVRPAAFAVQVNADGSVSFTARDLIDPAAATRSLNAAGIAGRVVNNTNGCAPIDSGDLAPGFVQGPHSRPRPSYTGPPVGFVTGDNTVTVRSSEYPPGGGVLVVVQLRERPTGPWAAVLYWAYADVDQIPSCVDVTDPGTD